MADALAKVKRSLGPDAYIVNTRSYRRGPGAGLLGSAVVEITASQSRIPSNSATGRERIAPASGEALTSDAALRLTRNGGRTGQRKGDGSGCGAAAVRSAETSSHEPPTAGIPADHTAGSDPLMDAHQRLLESEVAAELADDLVRRLRAELSEAQRRCPATVRAQLAAFVQSMIPVSPPAAPRTDGGPTVLALVGATGVGKTTTVAKLAANYSLRDGRRVGLITTDVYRVAAVEQLRTYADVLGIELRVTGTPAELRRTVERWSDRDAVLIDTPGRNPGDASRLGELGAMLSAGRAHEIHLVLPGTSSWPVLRRTIDAFKSVGVNRIIMSKLDEAVGFGVILNCLHRAQRRLSYVTTGQSVAEDIEQGSAVNVAGRLTGIERSTRNAGLMRQTCDIGWHCGEGRGNPPGPALDAQAGVPAE